MAITPTSKSDVSMRDHTEGPWQSYNDFDLDSLVTIVGGIDGPDDGRMHFTHVCSMNMDTPQFEANRLLVIAAPDLKDACNGLLGLIQLVCSRDDMPAAIREALQTSHRTKAAMVAIGKASLFRRPEEESQTEALR